jgi:hypothetical protein
MGTQVQAGLSQQPQGNPDMVDRHYFGAYGFADGSREHLRG